MPVCNKCGWPANPHVNPDDYLFVFGIEDKTYLNWQMEMFIYSACKPTKPDKFKKSKISPDNILVVVFNDYEPLSPYLANILGHYGVKHIKAYNYGRRDKLREYHEGGIEELEYAGANKLYAICEAWKRDYHKDYKYLALLDSDIFVYRYVNFHVFPFQNTTIAWNWLVDAKTEFFSNAEKAHDEDKGVDLPKLLESLHVKQEDIEGMSTGSVFMFFKSEDLAKNLINDLVAFKDIIWRTSRLIRHPAWIIDMPCYSLALANNGVKVDTVHLAEFDSTNMSKESWGQEVMPGSFVHYAHDCWGDYNWGGKFKYKDHTPFFDKAQIKEGLRKTSYDHGREFFRLCKRIAKEIPISRPILDEEGNIIEAKVQHQLEEEIKLSLDTVILDNEAKIVLNDEAKAANLSMVENLDKLLKES